MPKRNQPETPQDTITPIRQGMANKLSPRHGGTLSYELGQEPNGNTLYLRLTDNQPAGGLFSKAWVDLEAIADTLDTLPNDAPFHSSALQGCLTGKSKNQPGFTCAVLRAEGLLAIVQDKPFLHMKGHPIRDWLTAQTEASTGEKPTPRAGKRSRKSAPPSLFQDAEKKTTDDTTEP